ncbi:Tigger transposable element-derived protein, partial [Rhizoctonia solani]
MQKQRSKLCLTGAPICEKVREFCCLFNIPEDEVPAFHGEAASAPIDTIQAEVEQLARIIEPYDPNEIFRIDEIALFFCLPPNKGLATGHTSGVEADKIRVTYLLGSNMSGSEKLEPLVIGQAHRPHCFEGSEGDKLGFYYLWNSTAWMVQSIWQKFLFGLNACMVHQNQHVLLLRHARLAPSVAPDVGIDANDAFDAENAARVEAEAVQNGVARHPNLLEPEFMQMMEALSLSQPTEHELTDVEIVDAVHTVVSP